MTTLKQDLKPGDTKIYVNDLSAWNTNSGHGYNYAAIFGYQDSTGYVYPDGVYTRIVLAFGKSTNAKTNLDKTNNIITLNDAYNGTLIPAGRSVCAATAGSTYFYPFGAVARSSITNWTHKTATFNGNHGRLIAAKYIKYHVYSATELDAGIRIVNLTTLDNQINDSSGYQNDGTIVGNI